MLSITSISQKTIRPLFSIFHANYIQKKTYTPPWGGNTFYKRPLPNKVVSFTSAEGKKLFKESLLNNHTDSFFELISQFLTQNEPAFCALSTLAMILNTLQIDPNRRWKGPWRWWSEELLEGCRPLSEVIRDGVTFKEFAYLARSNGVYTIDRPGGDISNIEQFRSEIIKSIRPLSEENPIRQHLVISYSRELLGQTGDGHYSPIAGYHKETDQALILDVARFKYPPHWAKVDLIFEAMSVKDKVTGLPRGYFLLSKAEDYKEHGKNCPDEVLAWSKD